MRGFSSVFYFVLILFLYSYVLFVPFVSANTGTDSENTGLSKVELGSIIPFVTERGKVSLSVDGMGTLNATGTIQVQKPEGATVRNAYLMSATTGFTRRKLNDEEVTIEGIRDNIIVPKKIQWDISTPSSINSWNHWADITDFIKSQNDLRYDENTPNLHRLKPVVSYECSHISRHFHILTTD